MSLFLLHASLLNIPCLLDLLKICNPKCDGTSFEVKFQLYIYLEVVCVDFVWLFDDLSYLSYLRDREKYTFDFSITSMDQKTMEIDLLKSSGLIISKCLLVTFKSMYQKRTEILKFRWLFGRFEDTKRTFRNYLSLKNLTL